MLSILYVPDRVPVEGCIQNSPLKSLEGTGSGKGDQDLKDTCKPLRKTLASVDSLGKPEPFLSGNGQPKQILLCAPSCFGVSFFCRESILSGLPEKGTGASSSIRHGIARVLRLIGVKGIFFLVGWL